MDYVKKYCEEVSFPSSLPHKGRGEVKPYRDGLKKRNKKGIINMKDIEIVGQLLSGCHLDSEELERAENILTQIQHEIETRRVIEARFA